MFWVLIFCLKLMGKSIIAILSFNFFLSGPMISLFLIKIYGFDYFMYPPRMLLLKIIIFGAYLFLIFFTLNNGVIRREIPVLLTIANALIYNKTVLDRRLKNNMYRLTFRMVELHIPHGLPCRQ